MSQSTKRNLKRMRALLLTLTLVVGTNFAISSYAGSSEKSGIGMLPGNTPRPKSGIGMLPGNTPRPKSGIGMLPGNTPRPKSGIGMLPGNTPRP
jgi:hypothetical protein